MARSRNEALSAVDREAVAMARHILRTARHGALATLDPVSGAPLVSRVALATDADGAPVILVSELARHSAALLSDARAAVLLGEPGKGDPLAHPRLSLNCLAVRLGRETEEGRRAARRYLAHHPKARLYADFSDFAFFRLEPQSAGLNGGFARACELRRGHLLTGAEIAAAVGGQEQAVLEEMNACHGRTLERLARQATGAACRGWKMSGIDAEGFNLARGDSICRIGFPAPLQNPADLRNTILRTVSALDPEPK